MNRNILKLAIPNIISNITIPLLGMVDLAIVGRIGDESYIAAIALGGMIFNFIYWNFSFLRMSTSGFTAQACGAVNKEQIMRILVRGVTIALSAAIFILLLQQPIAWISKTILKSSDHTLNLALDYFYIRIWAVPVTLTLYVTNGWFIGMQNAKTPMYIAIFSNILNIIFSFFFAVTLDMKIKGVALGTVIAQYSGLILTLLLWSKKYSYLFKEINIRKSLVLKEMKDFFKVNSDIFLRNICIIAVFTFIPYISATMGDRTLAINALLLQLFMLFSYIIDGFAYAGESLVGKYIGAKKTDLLQKVVRQLLLWGAVLTSFFTVFYIFKGEWLLYLLTDNPSIVEEALQYLHWVVLVPIAGFAAFIFDGVYVGATASKMMRNIILLATLMFFTIFFVFKKYWGNNSLWLSLVLFVLFRSILMWLFNPKVIQLRQN